jgi:hypothetical protein
MLLQFFYLDYVSVVGGCPVKVRTDCGTENGVMAAMQCTFLGDINAHKYGSSPANQRIEAWWSHLRKNRSSWWIDFFRNLVQQNIFNPGNELHMACLWCCFSHLLQCELDQVKEHWNTHLIRHSRFGTVSGTPNELYHLPELHGGEEGLLRPVSDDQIQEMGENLSILNMYLKTHNLSY